MQYCCVIAETYTKMIFSHLYNYLQFFQLIIILKKPNRTEDYERKNNGSK